MSAPRSPLALAARTADTRSVVQVTIRALTLADRDAAVDVINSAARRYRGFLPPEEVHDPEMMATQWDEEARRLYATPEDRLRASVTYEKPA
jgi:hypothetical protein